MPSKFPPEMPPKLALLSSFFLLMNSQMMMLVWPMYSTNNFTAFSFLPAANSSSGIKFVHFPLPSTPDSRLNLSLTTGPNSGVVITGLLICHAELDRDRDLNSSNSLDKNASALVNVKAKPLLFASSLAYESVLIQLTDLPLARECQGQGEVGQSIELAINSMVPGGEGTIGLRQLGQRPEEGEQLEDGRIEAVDEEQLQIDSARPLLIPLNAPIGSELGELEQFKLDLAIRRGSVQLELVHHCPHDQLQQNNGSSSVFTSGWNQTFPLALLPLALGAFQQVVFGTSEPYERTFNVTILARNGSRPEHLFLDCPEPLANGQENLAAQLEQLANEPPARPARLFLNISTNSSAILAFALSRTFRPILVANEAVESEEAEARGWGWASVVLLGLLLPLLLLALLACATSMGNHLLLQRKRKDYERQRMKALEQQMGFFEINLHTRRGGNQSVSNGNANNGIGGRRPTRTSASMLASQRRVGPTNPTASSTAANKKEVQNIDLRALSRQALGHGPNWI